MIQEITALQSQAVTQGTPSAADRPEKGVFEALLKEKTAKMETPLKRETTLEEKEESPEITEALLALLTSWTPPQTQTASAGETQSTPGEISLSPLSEQSMAPLETPAEGKNFLMQNAAAEVPDAPKPENPVLSIPGEERLRTLGGKELPQIPTPVNTQEQGKAEAPEKDSLRETLIPHPARLYAVPAKSMETPEVLAQVTPSLEPLTEAVKMEVLGKGKDAIALEIQPGPKKMETPVLAPETSLIHVPRTPKEPEAVQAMPAISEEPVFQTILSRVETLKEGEQTTMKVKLNPEEWGAVEIVLAFKEGKISGHILAEKAEVRHFFAEKLPELQESLKASQIPVTRLDVGTSLDHSGRGTQQEAQNPWFERRQAFQSAGSSFREDHTIPGRSLLQGIDLLA